MAANGISTLPTKRERQIAKLNLAAQDRASAGNSRSSYVLEQLPTVYAIGDNLTANVIDNPNEGGLVLGRPWVSDPAAAIENFILENGDNFLTETGDFIVVE